MNLPTVYARTTTALLRYGLSLTAMAALLAGCDGSQPPFSASPQELAPQQSLLQPGVPHNPPLRPRGERRRESRRRPH